jgi:hypothetical protein
MPRSKGPVITAVRRGTRVAIPDEKGEVKVRPAPFDGLHIATAEGCIMYIDAKSAWEALDGLID